MCIQGVEKNNDNARRNFRSSNRWDGAVEIMRAEERLSEGQCTASVKRKYTKHKDGYWLGGGIVDSRKDRQKMKL